MDAAKGLTIFSVVVMTVLVVTSVGTIPAVTEASDHESTDVIVTTPEDGPQIRILVLYPFRMVEVPIDLPSPPAKQEVSRRTGVILTGLEVLPATTQNFWINTSVNASLPREADEQGIPAVNESVIGVQPLRYFDIETNLSAREVGGSTLDFSVRKSRLNTIDANATDVVLFHYDNGQWLPVPTKVVDESLIEYRYRADSPGLSVFAVGVNQPTFTVVSVNVQTNDIRVDDEVEISVVVNNIGRAAGTYVANLLVNGQGVDQKSVHIDSGESKTVVFTRQVLTPGSITFSVDGESAAVFVSPAPTPTVTTAPTDDPSTPRTPPPLTQQRVATGTEVTESPGQPGFTAVLPIIVILVVLKIYLDYR